MFGSLGVPELLLIFAVVLIVFGPRKLPEIGRTLGKALGEFRKATDDLKNTIEREVRIEELKKITPPSLEEFMTPPQSVSRTAPSAGPSPAEPVADAPGASAGEPASAQPELSSTEPPAAAVDAAPPQEAGPAEPTPRPENA